MTLMHLMPRRFSAAHQRWPWILTVIAATVAAFFSALNPAFVYANDIPDDIQIDLSSIVVSKEELICLALNDYWEARSEVIAGRIAVARVVLNRAMDPRYPSNICDVVKQSRVSGTLHRCQFSWYCDGKTDVPYDPKVWRDSLKIAAAVLQKDSAIPDPTDGALWYHADFTRPSWALGYESTTIIGTHVFYREPVEIGGPLKRKPFVERLNAFADFKAEQKTASLGGNKAGSSERKVAAR
ncbi:MAG: cell wall hydrolase [Rhodospirillaceae bacterium]|nr:cell wall hydrolase [Rhodospirillaceae bacterium]